MQNLRLLILLLSVILLATCGVNTKRSAQPMEEKLVTASLTDPLPLDPSIITGKLNNGLTYYIRKNAKPEKRCELRLAVNAGSILEDEDQLGLAHFCEHMAFNGSANFKKHELINYLESIGMKFGPEINAYTSFDETVYMLRLPTDSMEVLNKGLQVLEDWAHLVSYEGEEIDKERGVIIEEWRSGRGANARMRDKQFPILFQGSKYANRLPIGVKELLETFDHETLRRFYRDWYRPELMAVIAVGDFDPATVRQMITDKFGRMETAKTARPRAMFPVPDHEQTLFAIASDKEATYSSVDVFYKLPDEEDKTVADYRRNIVQALYNNMINERLQEISRQENAPFVMAFSSKGQFIRSREFYSLSAIVKDNGVEAGLKAVLTEAKRIQQHGFAATELERQKKNVLRWIETAYNERDKMESDRFADEYVRGFLYGEPLPGIRYEFGIYTQFVPGITLQEVNELAQQWMSGRSRVVMVDSPEKEDVFIPDQEKLQAILDEVNTLKVDPYIDKVTEKPLVDKTPQAGAVISEKKIEALGVTEWQLKNGVRVVLKPTDFKNDEIRFTASSPGGNSLFDDQDIVAAQTAASIIDESGIGEFNLMQLEKLLSGKVVSVSPYIGGLTEGFNGSASPKDLETLFQLIYLYFTASRADSAAFATYRSRMESYYQNRSLSPETAFQDTLNAVLTQRHPRYASWNLSTLDRFDLVKSAEFYKNRFADASDFTFFFVGNLNLPEIKPLVETWLGSLPAIHRNETWRDVQYAYPQGVIKRAVKRGVEMKSLDALVFTGSFDYSRENRYKAESMLNVLRIKLRERIREDLGGTYGVRVSGSWDHYPVPRYRITIQLGVNPERVPELTAEIMNQIDSLRNFGTTDVYLTKVKEMNRKEYEVNIKDNGFWLGNLDFKYFHSEDPMDIITYPDMVERLTLQDIQNSARQLLNKNNYVNLILYPEGWQER
jgi:zinc protease